MSRTLPLDAHSIVAGVPQAPALLVRARAVLAHAASRLVHLRLRCLLIGHDDTLAREPYRLFLHCALCGRATPGWAIGRAGSRGEPLGVSREGPRATRLSLEAPAGSVWGKWGKARAVRDARRLAAAARAAETRALGSGSEMPRVLSGPSRLVAAHPEARRRNLARLREAGRGDYGRGSNGTAG